MHIYPLLFLSLLISLILPLNYLVSIRQMKTSIDNTMFIYPLLFEKFQQRNLAAKIQLIEFDRSVTTPYPDPTTSYRILCNVYNSMHGPAYVTAGVTTVSYHCRTPSLNEEIKIRIPDIPHDRLYLLITVQSPPLPLIPPPHSLIPLPLSLTPTLPL